MDKHNQNSRAWVNRPKKPNCVLGHKIREYCIGSLQDCFTGHKKRWCDYLPVFMKDKHKAAGGPRLSYASFFKTVEELSDAPRHRAMHPVTGSPVPAGNPPTGPV